jgi:hypothetical protein
MVKYHYQRCFFCIYIWVRHIYCTLLYIFCIYCKLKSWSKSDMYHMNDYECIVCSANCPISSEAPHRRLAPHRQSPQSRAGHSPVTPIGFPEHPSVANLSGDMSGPRVVGHCGKNGNMAHTDLPPFSRTASVLNCSRCMVANRCGWDVWTFGQAILAQLLLAAQRIADPCSPSSLPQIGRSDHPSWLIPLQGSNWNAAVSSSTDSPQVKPSILVRVLAATQLLRVNCVRQALCRSQHPKTGTVCSSMQNN